MTVNVKTPHLLMEAISSKICLRKKFLNDDLSGIIGNRFIQTLKNAMRLLK